MILAMGNIKGGVAAFIVAPLYAAFSLRTG
jgi:hypothetical protein